MGEEITRRSRGVFMRSPSPSDLLVPFASLQKELAPQGETSQSLVPPAGEISNLAAAGRPYGTWRFGPVRAPGPTGFYHPNNPIN